MEYVEYVRTTYISGLSRKREERKKAKAKVAPFPCYYTYLATPPLKPTRCTNTGHGGPSQPKKNIPGRRIDFLYRTKPHPQ